MHRASLPSTLQVMLQQHAAAADIENDEELQSILNKLSDLHEKVEQVKLKARLKKQYSR